MSETLEPALPQELDRQAERAMRRLCDKELVRIEALKVLIELMERAIDAD